MELLGKLAVVEATAILFARSPAGLKTLVGEIQRGVVAKFGNKMETTVLGQLDPGVVAERSVINEVDQIEVSANQNQQGLDGVP